MSDLPKISLPAQRALQSAGITELEQLTQVTESELLQLHGMGPNALGKLRAALAEHRLSFRTVINASGGAMDNTIRRHLNNILSEDAQLQNNAFSSLMDKTEKPVSWAYEAWDELLDGLKHRDNHVRAISAQLLSNLAKSDPKGRILKDFDKLLVVTEDEKFVTARHCLQSLWKVGLAGKKQQEVLLNGLSRRYDECIAEKNCTLIRYDIIQDFRNLYDAVKDEKIKALALELIDKEEDIKYRKKYATIWRG